MPRVCLDPSARAEQRINDWIRGELIRQGKTFLDLAIELGVTKQAISMRLKGKTSWKFVDMFRAVQYLGGRIEEII